MKNANSIHGFYEEEEEAEENMTTQKTSVHDELRKTKQFGEE